MYEGRGWGREIGHNVIEVIEEGRNVNGGEVMVEIEHDYSLWKK
jgi:hypothetical protein